MKSNKETLCFIVLVLNWIRHKHADKQTEALYIEGLISEEKKC